MTLLARMEFEEAKKELLLKKLLLLSKDQGYKSTALNLGCLQLHEEISYLASSQSSHTLF